MENLNLHVGDHVLVEKGGEIIPKIVGVKEANTSAPPIRFITRCPVCGTPLVRYEGEAAHYCPNETGCPPLILGRIEHFISRKAMNINSLGPETIDDYYRQGLIHDAADLYELGEEQLLKPSAGDQKGVRKILKSIEESRQVPFERVLFAIGIRFVGEIAAKTLARYYGSMEAVANASLDSLQQINGIGLVIAQSVVSYFRDPKNLEFVQRLQRYGLRMTLGEEEQKAQSDRLQGKGIVISGVFQHHSRDEYKAMIEQHGGKNVGSISAKTSFVLAGENMGPAKLEKAGKLGIPIVSEEEFLKMLEDEEDEAD